MMALAFATASFCSSFSAISPVQITSVSITFKTSFESNSASVFAGNSWKSSPARPRNLCMPFGSSISQRNSIKMIAISTPITCRDLLLLQWSLSELLSNRFTKSRESTSLLWPFYPRNLCSKSHSSKRAQRNSVTIATLRQIRNRHIKH